MTTANESRELLAQARTMWDEDHLTAESLMIRALADHLETALADVDRFRAVGYFDWTGVFRSGCPPLTENKGWSTAFIKDRMPGG